MKIKEIESRFEEGNDLSLLKDPAEERQKALAEIDTSYKTGLNYYKENDLKLAEKEVVKVLKPLLPTSALFYLVYLCIPHFIDKFFNCKIVVPKYALSYKKD